MNPGSRSREPKSALVQKLAARLRRTLPKSGDSFCSCLESLARLSRTFAPFWDLQVGVRQDVLFGSGPDRDRTFAVLGVEGLAPYWFEVTPALFISDDGDVSARFTATYDLLLTQRLIAQPRVEVNAAVAGRPEVRRRERVQRRRARSAPPLRDPPRARALHRCELAAQARRHGRPGPRRRGRCRRARRDRRDSGLVLSLSSNDRGTGVHEGHDILQEPEGCS